MENKWDIVFLKREYFLINPDLKEVLDPNDIDKQTRRRYIFLNVEYKENTFFIPLRSNIDTSRNFGMIGYPVPSSKKPNAGLDFRKILVINDNSYIDKPEYSRIPKSQQIIIDKNYKTIKDLAINYIDGYVKTANKNREYVSNRFKMSTLHNFHNELGVKKQEKDIIKMILQHEKWLNSDGKIGKPLELQNENLSGMKFLNFNLRGVNFKNSNLNDCIIYADLSNANLLGMKMNKNTSWIGSNLTNARIDKNTSNFISNQLKNNIDKHKYGLNNLRAAAKEVAATKQR